MKYALEMEEVTKRYRDGESDKVVLDQVSFKVKPGEFVAIVGPSGSGKSTLLSIAGALLSPEEGKISIGGTSIEQMKQKEWTKLRKDKIGFIFQNHQLLPYLTTREQLELVQSIHGNQKDVVDIDELINDLGVSECKDKYPEQMSGGQKQRAAIARAFMNDPEIILADEPTASLDGERGRQVVSMILKEVKKRNKAAVMVTHDERVLDLVDAVYRMDQGVLVRVE